MVRFRTTWRRRWGGYVAIALLIGVVGGLGVGALAGARRTQSAFPAYLRRSDASDLQVTVIPRSRTAPDADQNLGGGTFEVLPVQQPAEIVSYQHTGNTPAALAAGLAASAVVALALTLAASVRRRRHDLALLKAIGFTKRQLLATVAWQASVAAVIGLAIGTPIGIGVGQWLWTKFARYIYAVPQATVPWTQIALVALAALVLANVAALIPGRAAARTRTALLLKSE